MRLFSLFFATLSIFVTTSTAQSLTEQLSAGISHRIDFFSDFFDPQHLSSIHLTSAPKFGSIALRANQAWRFEQTGTQFEIESYPILSDTFYGFANYGWSQSRLFPNHKAGLELFAALPYRSEASLGGRFLSFNGEPTYILTFSGNHYYHSWLFSVRPFFIFSDDGRGRALTAFARYFINDYGNFITVRGGIGVSPDSRTFLIDEDAFSVQQLLLTSYSLGADVQMIIFGNWAAVLGLDWQRRELSFDTGNLITNWAIMGGLTYSF